MKLHQYLQNKQPDFLRVVLLFALLALGNRSARALDSSRPPGGNFDLTHWYLGLPDSGASSVSSASLVAGYTNAQWFYTGADGAMVFWCPVNGGTTSGSSYPRSELRETLDPKDLSRNWTVFGTHVLDAQCQILQVPSTGRVVIGQIHSYLGNAYELIVLKYINGAVEAQVRNSPNATDKTLLPMGSVALGEFITYQIKLVDGLLSISLNGSNQTVNILQLDPAWTNQTFYFKAGSYAQDNSGPSSEGSRVSFYQLNVAHPVGPTAPSIATQPASQSATAGSNTMVTFRVTVAGTPPLSFQWRKDGMDVPDATNAVFKITPISTNDAGSFQVVVTNDLGSVTSQVAVLTVLPEPPPSALGEAADAPNLVWTTSGSPAWFAQSDVTHDGTDAVQSGAIGHSQATTLQTIVTGPGTVGFWWKVSSEPSNDRLLFYLGSSEKARITGQTGWEWKSFAVSSGTQVLKWTYSKNSSKTNGLDSAWLDQVQYIPNTPPSLPVIAIQPVGTNVDLGASANFMVAVFGPPTLKYQWQRNGTNLANSSSAGISGATSTTLKLTSLQSEMAGYYTVIVTNLAGSVTSAPALLTLPPVLTLAEALDTSALVWTTTGTPAWVGQTSVTHDGADAARSGAAADEKTVSMQTTVTGPGTLLFWWKASSETNKDMLQFYVGSTEAARISGEVNWQPQAFSIPPGSQVLRWSYVKNKSKSAGQDRAWVDDVQFVSPNAPDTLPGARSVAEAIQRANDYYIATSTFQSNGWARGVYQTGNMRAYDVLQIDRYRQWAVQWGEYFQWKGGFRGRTNADGQVCGQTYLDLYLLDPQPVRLADIKTGIDSRVAATAMDDWWWCDAFYMAGPVYARFSKLYSTNSYLDKMGLFYQDMKVRRGLFSVQHGLWYRDEEAKAATTLHGQKQFWGRGNGWVIAALARVLEQMPDNYPQRGGYITMLQTMAAALKPLQGADGFWRASLLDPTEVPNPETSSTALITFALAWGIRHGHLDADAYAPVVARSWNGLMALALHPDGKVGYAQPQGHIPEPANYNSTSDHGSGAFLLAGSEVYLLAGGAIPPSALDTPATAAIRVQIKVIDGGVVLKWKATPGKTYEVFYKDDFDASDWAMLIS